MISELYNDLKRINRGLRWATAILLIYICISEKRKAEYIKNTEEAITEIKKKIENINKE